MIRITYKQLKERAKDRPPGYDVDVMSKAKTMDDMAIYLEPKDWMELMAKYNPSGFGTLVHKMASPLANLSDFLLGTNLSNCGGCAERMDVLNKRA